MDDLKPAGITDVEETAAPTIPTTPAPSTKGTTRVLTDKEIPHTSPTYLYIGSILIGLIESIGINTYISQSSSEIYIPFIVMVIIGLLAGLMGLQMAKLIFVFRNNKDEMLVSRSETLTNNMLLVIVAGLFNVIALLLLNSVYFIIINAV